MEKKIVIVLLFMFTYNNVAYLAIILLIIALLSPYCNFQELFLPCSQVVSRAGLHLPVQAQTPHIPR